MITLWAYVFAVVSATVSWQPWQHLSGVFDLAGPRSDGRLVAAAGGRLFLVATDGAIAPFADGQGGYQVASGPEAYLDVSPGLHVGSANCNFARDDVFVIRPTPPIGITRVDPQGHAINFVDLTGVDSLNGIVFDTVGRFDHRLLVSGLRNQHSTIVAVDCKGGVVTITSTAPSLEGGFAVAPAGFGTHAGELVAPDENSGAIWTVSATGRSELLVASGIPHGGDIGVESAAFVPSGFTAHGGTAYVSDRATPNNPHVGTDNLLRMPASDVLAAGVRDGDLVVVAEGGALTIDVRCAESCTSTVIVSTGTSAHIEGHLVIRANSPRPAPSSLPAVADLGSQRNQLLVRLAIGAVIAAVLAAVVVLRARRARRR